MKFLSFFFVAVLCAATSVFATGNNILPDTLKKGKNYLLISKTSQIEHVSISKAKKTDPVLYIRFGFPTPVPASNVNSGSVLQSNRQYGENTTVPVFEKIDILKGKYADVKMAQDTKLRNLFTFTGVEYPLRLKLMSGKEVIDFELQEAGTWNIAIELKNN